MPTVNDFSYTWEQPNESKLNESLGADQNRAIATIKVKGDPATRRQTYLAVQEYPTPTTSPGVTRIAGPPVQVYYGRNVPLAYVASQFTSPDDGAAFLYCSKFVSGKGVGPDGEDANGPNFPLYQYYFYDCEFTDRSYDILPDSAVNGPAALSGAPASLTTTPGLGGQLAPGVYALRVSAVTATGETAATAANIVTVPALGAVSCSWASVAGALEYRLYATFNGVTIVVASVFSLIYTFYTFAGFPAVVPAANTSASPLAGLPDEGAAIGGATGASQGRYVTRNSRAANRGVTVPRGLYGYNTFTGTAHIPEGLLYVDRAKEVTLTHHMVPRAGVANQAILRCQGAINLYPFAGYPTGTLLYNGAEPRYYRTCLGGRILDLQHSFTYLPHIDRYGDFRGHNSVLGYLGGAKDGGGPAVVDFVYLNSNVATWSGNAPYRLMDFSTLFRPDQV